MPAPFATDSHPAKPADKPAHASGTFAIGGDLPVYRLGFGAMRITGKGVWGPPAHPDECVRVLRRALELGITFIDTADSYGPFVSEELIAKALRPYPKELVIATKAGFERPGPDKWVTNGRPEYLRAECDGSLARLGVERIDLFQLHRIDRKVPEDEQFGMLAQLQREGKVRHVGLSEVSVAEIERARRVVPIATVQNKYNLVERESEPVLDYCTNNGIGFIPWFPLAASKLAGDDAGTVDTIAKRLDASPAQVALAWLLARSPVMLPIPGTSRVPHLEQNARAAELSLTREDCDLLSRSS